MALRFALTAPSITSHVTSSSHASAAAPAAGSCFPSSFSKQLVNGAEVGGSHWRTRPCVVKCSVDTVVPAIGQVTEVNKDSFWPIVRAAGDKAVVLDMYTQWCGPCKVMAPKFKELSQKYTDVVFLKLDCNQENKPLAKELGIRVVPTFKILKDAKVVKEVTGAKVDDLVLAIETVRSG